MIDLLQFPDEDAAIKALAAYLVTSIGTVLSRQPFFRWALAGGSTPRRLYRYLAQPDIARKVDWRRIQLFWGDERCVPPTDAQSNYRMAKESLLDHIPIPEQNVFPIDGALEPELAAKTYAALLAGNPMDLVLLGMGDDGHTASLFLTTPHLRDETRSVIATRSPLPPANRISLSLRTINAAHEVVFLVLGEHKADRLAQVIGQHGSENATLPAALVHPQSGILHWFVDQAAAARLKSRT
jgi:6-phosphogluconolactonase